MPPKLKVLLVLMALSVGFNLIGGKWLSVIMGVLLALGVLKGSEGTRMIVIGFSALGLIFAGLTLFVAIGFFQPIVFLAGLLGAAQSGFTLWCLMSADVQDWMYKRSLPDSVRDL
jgi:hypothetical protein